MIKSVTVINYLGDSIKLDLARPELSGFAIIGITGLGPEKADINVTEVATNDGGIYNSARKPTRNIVISMYYLWANTIEESRHKCYKFFPLKKKVKLIFETEERIVSIEGYVESNTPNIFSKTEGTNISILCPDPNFYDAKGDGIYTTVFSGIEPKFEFPFSNESLTEPLIEMGVLSNKTYNYVNYTGDNEIGIIMRIHALGIVKDITIYQTEPRGVMKIDTKKIETYTGSGIVMGDDIIISTVKGHKSVTLIRGGKEYNILHCISRDSDWFELHKGDNIFSFTATEGVTNLQFKIEHKLSFEGV